MRALALVLVVGCAAPETHKVPSAAIAPVLQSRTPSTACGTDIALDENGAVVLRYRFTFDDYGRIAQARGTWVDHSADDVIDYRWDNLDHMVHLVQNRASSTFEITAQYDSLGDLLEYTRTDPNYRETQHTTYANLTDAGQPTREVISVQSTDVGYTLEYDPAGRVSRITPDTAGEPATVYTYDDDAKTLTITVGTYHGLVTYDDQNHELFESWDGPDQMASEQTMTWDGDRLLTVTWKQGSADAPHDPRTVEVDTYRYSCTL